MLCFRPKKLSVFSIGSFNSSFYNVARRYDSVLFAGLLTVLKKMIECANLLSSF